jgi:hypothetical protein
VSILDADSGSRDAGNRLRQERRLALTSYRIVSLPGVIADYFGCPRGLPEFDRVGSLSPEPGFFAFGPGVTCYGRSSSPRSMRPVPPLYDASADVSVRRGVVGLPLDPDEIVENLRHERYRRDANGSRGWFAEQPTLRTLYYRVRDLLPRSVRIYLQKMAMGDWRTVPFPSWPVDGTVERILERLLALSMKAQGVQEVPFIWFWPHGASSCVVMTHDVETLAGLQFCSRLMDLDDAVGIKSSFQIVPERRYSVPDALLNEIRARQFEINVHDLNHDGRLFADYHEFVQRAHRINEYGRRFGALGFRSGGLYRNLAWYDALEFSFDMSVPSTGRIEPQRGGCCSLMPFFIGRLLELPLTTIQDHALFHILNDYSIDLWERQLDAIEERHGLATFLIHPDYVIDEPARTTYQALLAHIARMRNDKGLWIALPNEVDRWWRQRSQMRIVSDNGRPRIEGEGKEHARLGVATLAGDTVELKVEGR